MKDDVANVKWKGNWRMPTYDEFCELKEKCEWEWTTLDGKNGYKVTSKTTGNSIFLPAAGNLFETFYANKDSGGLYWSSSLDTSDPSKALRLFFDSSDISLNGSLRKLGFSVRPVIPVSADLAEKAEEAFRP